VLAAIMLATCAVPGRAATPVPALDAYPAAGPAPQTQVLAPQRLLTDTVALYLPLLQHSRPPSIFGTQLGAVSGPRLDALITTDSGWVRAAGVSWSAVQPAGPDDHNWSALASNEAQWINAAQHNLKPIVIVSNTPTWAQAKPGYFCGPIKPQNLADFGNFMFDLVQRYSGAPYNVHYWEIWNEPDVDASLVPPNSAFGCLGNKNDPYYGGGAYADLLKAVYPRIKAADPSAQVMTGGLLLNCDPNLPAVCPDPLPARFFEGVLRAGGGPYFDIVSFHAYDVYGDTQGPGLGHFSLPNWNTAWNAASGPRFAAVAKANYLRGLLATYNVTGKQLLNSEVAVISYEATRTATFETTKAYHVARVYATALAQGFLANVWFSLDDDWHWVALLDPATLAPRPSFVAYQFAADRLGLATYVRVLTGLGGVTGYEFRRDTTTVWVLWATNDLLNSVTLPSVPTAAFHVDGTPLAVPTTSLSVGHEPLYVEWGP
jgi:hypothetical protein